MFLCTSQDCVNKTIARIRVKLEREDHRVLNHVVYSLRSSDRSVQQAVAVSLAQLAPVSQLKNIFVDKGGLDVLLDLLQDKAVTSSGCEFESLTVTLCSCDLTARNDSLHASVYRHTHHVHSRFGCCRLPRISCATAIGTSSP